MSIEKIKKLKKSDLGVSVLLIIGILVVVNFLSYQIFTRFDLTENKAYSISQVSKKTVKELDDIVNIKVYFSEDLPSQFITLRQEVGDILDEYEAYSDGNIRIEFINPDDDESTARELYTKGIPQLTFQTFEKDKAQVVNGYMGMTISFGDNTEVIPVLDKDTSSLEYQVTTAIKKITAEQMATIAFLASNGTANLQQEISSAYQAVSELYSVDIVDLAEQEEIPAAITTLIIAGPKEEFSEAQLETLEAFLARGGNVLALVDGVLIEQGLQARANNTGLESLLAERGVSLENNLVADVRNAMASFSQGFMTFSTNYPFWPKITSDSFNKDNSAVSGLESVVLRWASSLDIASEQEENIIPLAYTSPKAWQEKDKFNLNPQQNIRKSGDQKFTLAALIEAGQEGEGRIIVVGDSDFIVNNNNADNLTFFQNLVDSLSLDDDLISIRSKTVTSRPIQEDLEDGTRGFIRYANIFGVTIVVLVFGMTRYYLRRKSRFIDEL
jgi:gliding-associated putative ABC transporter substrate-binding component GldG